MPRRETPLKNNYYYHIFNRSVGKIPISSCKADYFRAINLINYYRFNNTPIPFSAYLKNSKDNRNSIFHKLLEEKKYAVKIIAHCLMPNHFHFLLQQKSTNGIMNFIANFQNSYAKYYNIKYKRTGALFENSFKAVLVMEDSQLLHLSRYIHLNPYSSLVVNKIDDLMSYEWSSLKQYLNHASGFCQPNIILKQYNNVEEYWKFVSGRADFQRELSTIKHLLLE